VSGEDLPNLYRSTVEQSDGLASPTTIRHKVAARFRWRARAADLTGNARPLQEMVVWLLPPRPFHTVANERSPGGAAPNTGKYDSSGLWLVEAVDVRYWWQFAQLDTAKLNDLHLKEAITQDAGFLVRQPAGQTYASPQACFDAMLDMLPVQRPTIVGGTAVIVNLPTDRELPAQMSVALLLDRMAVGSFLYAAPQVPSGFNISLQVDLKTFSLDRVDLPVVVAAPSVDGVMAGGYEAGSGAPYTNASNDFSLPMLWEGAGGTATSEDGVRYQWNRCPTKVGIGFEWRAVEGRTWRNTVPLKASSVAVLGHDKKNYEVEQDVSTTRLRPPTIGTVTPMAHIEVAEFVQVDTNYQRATSNPFGSGNLRGAFPAASAATYASLYAWRQRAMFGRMVFSGWTTGITTQQGFATVVRHTIRRFRGEFLPIAVFILDEDDWMLGPSGKVATDPKDVVHSIGQVSAKRLGTGELFISVPSPVRRPFAARITSASRQAASGNGYWRWLYEWEEVQRVADSTLTAAFEDVDSSQDRNDNGLTAVQRKARNSLEDSNIYVGAANASNFIAPGYLQGDYPAATMECQPIAVGTVVTMWEDFRDCDKPPTIVPQTIPDYWFSLPNVPKFTC
jgi:hypothetical protein